MYPVLAHLGPLTLRSWGLLVAIGVIMGTMLAARRAQAAGLNRELIYDFVIFAVIAGFVGSRIWEVIFTWGKYAARPIEALYIWNGGLSIQGGVAGAILYTLWFARKHQITFWSLADILAPGLILGQAFGRIGCFLNGDAYGVPTTSGLGVIYQPGTMAYSVYGATPLIPAELMEAGWDIIVLGILLSISRRRPLTGLVALAYLGLYSAGRFVLEYWRADSLQIWGMKTAQLTSLVTIAVVLGIGVYLKQRARKLALKK